MLAYYQQIGRAGRQLDEAYAIMLIGAEDDKIQEYFINTAFPNEKELTNVLIAIEEEDKIKKNDICKKVNLRVKKIEQCLKFLEILNVIAKEGSFYYRTANRWNINIVEKEKITQEKDKNIRNGIINGNCIILSAVHPEERFFVYNAMDRNKYIYAASEYALVVSSDYQKGGTWSGAIENYKKDWSKILVRKDADIPIGNQKLLEMDGIIPIEDLPNNFSIEQYVSSFKSKIKKIQTQQMKLF